MEDIVAATAEVAAKDSSELERLGEASLPPMFDKMNSPKLRQLGKP